MAAQKQRNYTSLTLALTTHAMLAKVAKANKRPLGKQIELFVEEEYKRLGLELPAEILEVR